MTVRVPIRRLATALPFVVPALLGLPSVGRAQQGGSCAPLDTMATWYRKQKAWLDDSRHDWSNDSLRTALMRAAQLDREDPTGPLSGYELVVPNARTSVTADSATLNYLRNLIRTRGTQWPTRSVVGAAGVRAAWLLVGQDSALSRAALHRMMEAGPDESPPAAVATLEDRIRVQSGRKQLYGTQVVRRADGTVEPLPIEDPKHVDLRRDAAGLPPLAHAKCAARATMVR